LATDAGQVVVEAAPDPAGGGRATLTSVPSRHRDPTTDELEATLSLLGWGHDELDPALPPAVAYAGAWHLVLAAATRERLARLSFPEPELGALMQAAGWTTLQLVWREDEATFHARDPAPGIGIPEDPATGAAAAALGGWLRDAGHLRPPADLVVHQGVDLGRPSRLDVHVPAVGGIRVSGRVLPLAGPLEVE
jgi:PhzF family phenazine biosynthesis protein